MDSVATIYAPPASSQSQLQTGYFKCTLGSISYMEIARLTSIFALPILWTMKFLRTNTVLAQGIPNPERLEEMRVPPASLLPRVRQALEGLAAEAAQLGFEEPIFYRQKTSLLPESAQSAAATCRHRDGRMFANLIVYMLDGRMQTVLGVITAFTDGTFFAVGSQKRQFIPDPRNGVVFLPGKTIAEVTRKHGEECGKWAANRQVRVITTTQDLDDALYDYSAGHHEWQVSRGVYQTMTADEVAALRRSHASATKFARTHSASAPQQS